MRISLLLKREPFPRILERALADFLTKRYGTTYTVTWQDKRVVGKSRTGQEWLCNFYLNCFFVHDVKKVVLLPVILEFSRSTKQWRIPVQRIYVWLATARFTNRLFAAARLIIAPPLEDAESMLIIGGNHHIRLLDYVPKCCYVIRKSGFDNEFMAGEIRIRRENAKLPCPAILEVAEDGSWYSEELILGTPLNRLKDRRQADKAAAEVSVALFDLYERTAETVAAEDYVGSMVSRIEQLVRGNLILTEEVKSHLIDCVSLLRTPAVIKPAIVTVQSHGDFQPANILYADGKTWLIDWEYTERRQIGYDGMVYYFASRFPKGLSERIRQSLTGNSESVEQHLLNWPKLGWSDQTHREAIVSLFFLEEIELRLLEISTLTDKAAGRGFEIFCYEAKMICEHFKSTKG